MPQRLTAGMSPLRSQELRVESFTLQVPVCCGAREGRLLLQAATQGPSCFPLVALESSVGASASCWKRTMLQTHPVLSLAEVFKLVFTVQRGELVSGPCLYSGIWDCSPSSGSSHPGHICWQSMVCNDRQLLSSTLSGHEGFPQYYWWVKQVYANYV